MEIDFRKQRENINFQDANGIKCGFSEKESHTGQHINRLAPTAYHFYTICVTIHEKVRGFIEAVKNKNLGVSTFGKICEAVKGKAAWQGGVLKNLH